MYQGALVSIIITHYNYSAHLEQALKSVTMQTYGTWECVVVDDCSDFEHARKAQEIVEAFGRPNIRFIRLAENKGQIPAFYAGVDATIGDFVCLLDPDDYLLPDFIKESMAAHLNEFCICPLTCSDQILIKDGEQISGTNLKLKLRLLTEERESPHRLPCPDFAQGVYYIPAHQRGWHWTSTSSMMFRRGALMQMRPLRKLAYRRSADTYLAHGAHVLGGSLIIAKPLVERHIHLENSWIGRQIYATDQDKRHHKADKIADMPFRDVEEAIADHGGQIVPERRTKPRKSFTAKMGVSIKKRFWRQ